MQKHVSIFPTLLSCFILTISSAAHSGQAKVNPDFAYFYNGDITDGWQWVLADPENWWMPLEGNEGTSAAGKLTMAASDSPKFSGAIKLVWKKTQKWASGTAKITGRTVDLSAYEHTAELMLALKLDKRTSKPVHVTMTCGDKCKAEVSIHDHLKAAKLNEWFALPIPLDCFVEQGADLKNITSPFSISTSGEMILHIAEISLRPMAKGEKGCVSNSDTSASSSP